jgi:hypothetical protein
MYANFNFEGSSINGDRISSPGIFTGGAHHPAEGRASHGHSHNHSNFGSLTGTSSTYANCNLEGSSIDRAWVSCPGILTGGVHQQSSAEGRASHGHSHNHSNFGASAGTSSMYANSNLEGSSIDTAWVSRPGILTGGAHQQSEGRASHGHSHNHSNFGASAGTSSMYANSNLEGFSIDGALLSNMEFPSPVCINNLAFMMLPPQNIMGHDAGYHDAALSSIAAVRLCLGSADAHAASLDGAWGSHMGILSPLGNNNFGFMNSSPQRILGTEAGNFHLGNIMSPPQNFVAGAGTYTYNDASIPSKAARRLSMWLDDNGSSAMPAPSNLPSDTATHCSLQLAPLHIRTNQSHDQSGDTQNPAHTIIQPSTPAPPEVSVQGHHKDLEHLVSCIPEQQRQAAVQSAQGSMPSTGKSSTLQSNPASRCTTPPPSSSTCAPTDGPFTPPTTSKSACERAAHDKKPQHRGVSEKVQAELNVMMSPIKKATPTCQEELGCSEHEFHSKIARELEYLKICVAPKEQETLDFALHLEHAARSGVPNSKRDTLQNITPSAEVMKRPYTNNHFLQNRDKVVQILKGTPWLLLVDKEFFERQDVTFAILAMNFEVTTADGGIYCHIQSVESGNRDKGM